MHLFYFDENKYSEENPFFWIGGIMVPPHKDILRFEADLTRIQYDFFGKNVLEKDAEFHGKEIFHGKGQYKGRSLLDRVKLFQDIAWSIILHRFPVRMVCIDVNWHRNKYYNPIPEYQLGLMLILERICDYLDHVNDLGIVFGDYEKDEITKAVSDFSQFKNDGKTGMYLGRPLRRLVDTVYFTHSHHSRFLQVADVLVYMAGRYENNFQPVKWHDVEIKKAWENVKVCTDVCIQNWPSKKVGTTSSVPKDSLLGTSN